MSPASTAWAPYYAAAAQDAAARAAERERHVVAARTVMRWLAVIGVTVVVIGYLLFADR